MFEGPMKVVRKEKEEESNKRKKRPTIEASR